MEKMFLEGFLLQASLIFALGAQNLFILESGVKRNHHLTISFVCFLCDLTLIMLGVAGAATLFTHFPQIKILVGILGVGFLFAYGWGKFKATETDFSLGEPGSERSLKQSVVKAITFSLVNPHAYLDGIVLIGGFSSKYDVLAHRLMVGLGASICSLVWFLLLSNTSSRLMPVFKDPRRMRWMMGTAGIALMYLSVRLSFDVYGWLIESLSATPAITTQSIP